MSNGLP